MFAKKLSDESSRRAKGAVNFRLSSAEDKWEAYKQRMAVRHGMENVGEANLRGQPLLPSVDGVVWPDEGDRTGKH